MQLILGSFNTIEDPTPDDVRHYLRYMPVQDQWIMLTVRDQFEGVRITAEFYVLGRVAGLRSSLLERYRLIYVGAEGKRYVCRTDYDSAVNHMLSFLRSPDAQPEHTKWSRMYIDLERSISNSLSLAVLIVLGAAAIFGVWHALQTL